MNDDIQSLLNEAANLRQQGRVEEAIAAYRRLLAKVPHLADSWYNLGWLQRQARDFEAALRSYARALEHNVSAPEEVHLNRAVILSDHVGRPEEAETELHKALAINPVYVPALLNLGNLHEDHGRRQQAQDCYREVLRNGPGHPLALARLAGLADSASEADVMIGHLRAAMRSPAAAALDVADLGFALGRLLDRQKRFDEAFATYTDANLMARRAYGPRPVVYDRAAAERLVDSLISTFDRPARGPGDHRPLLFICGLFRSGSTLAETILSRHGKVTAAGELDLLPSLLARLEYPRAAADPKVLAGLRADYLSGVGRLFPEADVLTDKRPDNFLHLGLIKALFPAARIIHTRRDLRDNILSLFFLHAGPDLPYAFSLDDITHWITQYRRLMAHWQALYPQDIFDLDYDVLVREPRSVLEPLFRFCGLAFEEESLAFYRTSDPVKTASVWQVREPLHARSSGRWRNYAGHLAPYLERLDQAS